MSELVEGSEGTVEETQRAPIQIYDVPYEGSSDSEKMTATRPELDARPADEYELPWEWRKEHIVRTLSGTVFHALFLVLTVIKNLLDQFPMSTLPPLCL